MCAGSWPEAGGSSTGPTSATRDRPRGWTSRSWRCWSRPAWIPGRPLAAATSLAAAHLGLTDTGRIVPGARADLLLVEGDPLDDLAALERVLLVTRDGRVHG